MTRLLVWLGAGLLCVATGPSTFAEDDLYGKQPNQHAVFLRFVSAVDANVSITSNLLPPSELGTVAKDRIGPFSVIDRADAATLAITAKVGGLEARDTVPLKAGTAISVLVRKDGSGLQFKIFSTPFELNPSRTILSFLNAAPACGSASLTIEPAHSVIFANVPVDGERARRINSVNAEIGVTCGALGTTTANLERSDAGSAYSVWLMALGGRPVLILHLDTLPVWHP